MGLKSLVHFQDLLYIGSRTLPSCTFISHYYIYNKINFGETSKWVHSQLGSGTEIYVCSLYLPPHLLSSIESRPAANKTQISAILSCLKSKPMNKAYLCSIQRTERTDFCSMKRHGTLSPPPSQRRACSSRSYILAYLFAVSHALWSVVTCSPVEKLCGDIYALYLHCGRKTMCRYTCIIHALW